MTAEAANYDIETQEFRLTRSDYLQFNSHHVFSTLHRPRNILGLLLFPAAMTCIAIHNWLPTPFGPRSALAGIVFFVLAALCWAVLLSFRTWLAVEFKWRKTLREPRFQHDTRAALNEDGAFYLNPETQTRWAWTSIKRVATTKSLILVYITDAAALIVPKRAFDGADHAERFEAFARSHSVQGRRSPSSQP
jgi:hypothetical protein